MTGGGGLMAAAPVSYCETDRASNSVHSRDWVTGCTFMPVTYLTEIGAKNRYQCLFVCLRSCFYCLLVCNELVQACVT